MKTLSCTVFWCSCLCLIKWLKLHEFWTTQVFPFPQKTCISRPYCGMYEGKRVTKELTVQTYILCYTQVLGSLFAPSQKIKKLSHHFRVCFELVFGILNAPRKIFLAVYEPILKLQGLQGVGFQGKKCFTKMVSNVSEINFGFR